ncbi:hypothetical protein Poli38472_003709 [Pythium oligandrum]|uniref:Uncharacterized protein n=1 Tax=Pythium oligandrum TaxID=41045 RepID=A0A8K1CMR4_PYTOL|nr:hypothetical protein Poli38472_003709 [Pythium oligandrum]|eukprot:TMW65944.1 hypothetical protein Poli38472_003709 [Pythium oligandrum]
MLSLRCALAARPALAKTATHRFLREEARTGVRFLSSEPSIRRPKALKVKKSEARRRVEPKPKADNNALVEQQEQAQAPVEYGHGPFTQPQAPQTFGGMMKESFFWGFGMAIAFTFVGVIFSAMEETDEAGAYMATEVISTADEHRDEQSA